MPKYGKIVGINHTFKGVALQQHHVVAKATPKKLFFLNELVYFNI
jgi:hypothetical protein